VPIRKVPVDKVFIVVVVVVVVVIACFSVVFDCDYDYDNDNRFADHDIIHQSRFRTDLWLTPCSLVLSGKFLFCDSDSPSFTPGLFFLDKTFN
jgi:hypothetical protein